MNEGVAGVRWMFVHTCIAYGVLTLGRKGEDVLIRHSIGSPLSNIVNIMSCWLYYVHLLRDYIDTPENPCPF